jgi:hypothetical protein
MQKMNCSYVLEDLSGAKIGDKPEERVAMLERTVGM